jgi:NADH-quinone oxidoreductase subunit L
MTIPLIVLGILSAIGGWIGIPHLIGNLLPGEPSNVLERWTEPLIKALPEVGHADPAVEWGMMGVSVLLAVIFAGLAYNFYVMSPGRADQFTARIKGLYRVIYNKYFVDEFYFSAIINPLVAFSRQLWQKVDVMIIDRTTYVAADLVKGAGGVARSIQNGNIQQYAFYIAIGVVVALSFILMR